MIINIFNEGVIFMEIPLIDLKAQINSIETELKEAVYSVLLSGEYILGNEVILLEQDFCKYLNCKHSISVGNGTDALVIALKSIGINPGDEVIVSPFTFFASAESISRVGAIPIFVDIRKDSLNIDSSKIEAKINKKTKAIMVVHLFGLPADMDSIIAIAKMYNLKVIEDCCQAIGSEYKGKKVGVLGDVSCFSFFPTKNLGCAGDGGMIVTNDDDIALISHALRSHGSGAAGKRAYTLLNTISSEFINTSTFDTNSNNVDKYLHYLVGYNSRLDTIQAAILRVKLKFIDSWNNLRRSHADYYNNKLKNAPLTLPSEPNNCKHVYHMYILQSEKRATIIEDLRKHGIGIGIYYPVPLHLQIVYKDLGYNYGDFPCAEYLSSRTFAIPIYPELTKKQQDYIVDTLLSCEL